MNCLPFLISPIRNITATPKVRRRFEAATNILDGLISFTRNSLPTMLTEAQFIEKAYSIRGFSSKLLSNLSKFDTDEIQQTSAKLPLKISSREIVTKQVDSSCDVYLFINLTEKSLLLNETSTCILLFQD